MKVFANFPHELPPEPAYPAVTLGVFDGLHRGHHRILTRLLEVAAGRATAVVTFDPHPRAVLGPPKRHRLLSPIQERLGLFEHWPLGAVAILRFDQSIARLTYVEFVRRVLVQGLGARHLVLGYNVALGNQRQGNAERLAELGRDLGYQLDRVPAVEVGGQVVSSTLVRHLLDQGDVVAARRFLGRPYDITGTVIRGAGRGQELGIPTANLDLPVEKLLPGNGVYAVCAELPQGSTCPGALNIGFAPTFQDAGERSVEVHLLGFEGDLYGTRVRLHLLQRLRDERRFEGPEALRRQLQADLDRARRLYEPVRWGD